MATDGHTSGDVDYTNQKAEGCLSLKGWADATGYRANCFADFGLLFAFRNAVNYDLRCNASTSALDQRFGDDGWLMV